MFRGSGPICAHIFLLHRLWKALLLSLNLSHSPKASISTDVPPLTLLYNFHTGLFTEFSFVLAEGSYEDGIFHVNAFGFPPPELAKTTRFVLVTWMYEIWENPVRRFHFHFEFQSLFWQYKLLWWQTWVYCQSIVKIITNRGRKWRRHDGLPVWCLVRRCQGLCSLS